MHRTNQRDVFSVTLSFLSCLAYGKHGITAVTREADAILHAFIIINSSMRLSFISPEPDCTMYTSSPRTDSPISTLQTESSWQLKSKHKKQDNSKTEEKRNEEEERLKCKHQQVFNYLTCFCA